MTKLKTETTEHDSLNDDLKDKTNHIHRLEMKNAELVDLLNVEAQKLNNELSQNETKFKKEKVAVISNFEAEIKALKKDLGKERKEKIKLETKLDVIKEDVEERRVLRTKLEKAEKELKKKEIKPVRNLDLSTTSLDMIGRAAQKFKLPGSRD